MPDYYDLDAWAFSINDIFKYIDDILVWISECKEHNNNLRRIRL